MPRNKKGMSKAKGRTQTTTQTKKRATNKKNKVTKKKKSVSIAHGFLDRFVVKVDEVEVNEHVPRKREKSSHAAADKETWMKPTLKFEDLDLDVSHLDDEFSPAELEAARIKAELEASAEAHDSESEASAEGGLFFLKEGSVEGLLKEGPVEGLLKDASAEGISKQGSEDAGEEEVKATAPQVSFRRKRWINKGPAITDIHDAPHDWTEHEPDLHPMDHVAQIARCRERIEDNIMPAIFKAKMERYTKLKESQEKALAKREEKYPGLDSATATRVETLVQMHQLLLEQKEDPFHQIINIKALVEAYTSGKLKWYGKGFVTYWSYGVQKSQPRGFKLEEFDCIRKHFPEMAFWVEGINGPGPEVCGAAEHYAKYENSPLSLNPNSHNNYIRIAVSMFGGLNYTRLTFMQDTGATFMTLYENDLKYLQSLDQFSLLAALEDPNLGVIAAAIGAVPSPIVCHSYVTLTTVAGQVVRPVTVVTVCVHSEEDGEEVTSWDSIQAVIMPGERALNPDSACTIPRLDGAWLRWKTFRLGPPAQLDPSVVVAGGKRIVETKTKVPHNLPRYAKVKLGPMAPPAPGMAPGTAFFPGDDLVSSIAQGVPSLAAGAPAGAAVEVGPGETAGISGEMPKAVGFQGVAPSLDFTTGGLKLTQGKIAVVAGWPPSYWDA